MLLQLLVLGLAVWRVTSLLATEQGPYDIFDRFRYWAGVRYEDNVTTYLNQWAEGLVCPWCLSVWVGVVAAVCYAAVPTVAFWGALPLALSAAAILVNHHIS